MNLFEHSFSETPVTLDLQRSKFKRPHSHKTTFNQGQLVPIFVDEVLPGDTFQMDMRTLVRMATPIFPVMDNADLDVYFFFVPNRLTWEHWKEFCGENTTEPWTQTTEYIIPKVRLQNTGSGVPAGSLLNHLGIPARSSAYTNVSKVNALPLRAYYLIWNEWFRDENLQYPINVYRGDNDVNLRTSMTNNFYFGYDLLPVQRYPDYFSTALPGPQKGPDVNLPLGDFAPVYASSVHTGFGVNSDSTMKFVGSDNTALTGTFPTGIYNGSMYQYNGTPSGSPLTSMKPDNLIVDLSQATASTVNELRQAFAVQRLYEKDAIGGTRYRELLRSHFGVSNGDSRLQIPEYLGGFRTPLSMEQVVQTSSSTATSPIGNTSAFSVTRHAESLFTKSFTEHGYIIGLACVRVEHSYSQGLAPMFSRERRFDFYWPALANIGNQPIYKRELYYTGDNQDGSMNDDVFGYKEAWAEYRYAPNTVSGLFSSTETTASGLQSWIYTDFYTSSPSLSDTWMREGDSNVKNTIAVQTQPQFIADFYFDLECSRPMPLYSVPGLIDHH